MCPQCTNYLARAIMLDIHWKYSERDCAAIAEEINEVLAAM